MVRIILMILGVVLVLVLLTPLFIGVSPFLFLYLAYDRRLEHVENMAKYGKESLKKRSNDWLTSDERYFKKELIKV